MLQLVLKNINLADYDTRVYATMAVVGVFCLLRIGELCSVKYENRSKFICNKDIKFAKGHAVFTLFNTKTDKDKKGVVKAAGDARGHPNPYRMLYVLKSTKTSSTGAAEPFFALRNGRPVTRYLFVKWLKTTLQHVFPQIPAEEWNGISIRKGGATSALRAGVAGEVIQRLGNWTSEAYKTYIDHAPVDIIAAQLKMSAWARR
jgi:hypothetical protein